MSENENSSTLNRLQEMVSGAVDNIKSTFHQHAADKDEGGKGSQGIAVGGPHLNKGDEYVQSFMTEQTTTVPKDHKTLDTEVPASFMPHKSTEPTERFTEKYEKRVWKSAAPPADPSEFKQPTFGSGLMPKGGAEDYQGDEGDVAVIDDWKGEMYERWNPDK
jgi:hypothetical protein